MTDCHFPVYGLDESWTGRRWVGGWGSSGDAAHSFELGHGEAHDEAAALVRVETAIGPHRSIGLAAIDLAQALWLDGAEHTESLQRTFTAAEPTAHWESDRITVSGSPTEFRRFTAGDSWVAVGEVDEATVSIQARRISSPDCRLVRITHFEPYLADSGLPR